MTASNCPPAHEIAFLAGDVLPSDRAAVLLSHISECESCAKVMAEAMRNLKPGLTAEEERTVDKLMDFRPMAPARSPYYRYALLAASLILAGALGTWLTSQRHQADPVAQLLQQSYTTTRPFDWRLPDAGYSEVHVELGGAKPELAVVQQAEVAVDKLPTSGPDIARTLNAKGWLALLKGEPEIAVQTLEQSARAAPQDPGVASRLGVAYALRAGVRARQGESDLATSDYRAAIERWSQALRDSPDDRLALFNRGLAYLRMGQVPEARRDFEEYLLKDPSSQWSNEVRKRLSSM